MGNVETRAGAAQAQLAQPNPGLSGAGLVHLGGIAVAFYGALMLIDVVVAALKFPDVPFNIGPPLPSNWGPNLLVGVCVLGSGAIAMICAKRQRVLLGLAGMLIAGAALFEIVLLDSMYAQLGRPALVASAGQHTRSMQDRLEDLYWGGVRPKRHGSIAREREES